MGLRGLGTAALNDRSALAPSWAGPFFVSDAAKLKDIVALRELVWRSEPDLADAHALQMGPDAHDAHGLHWIVEAEGAVVAAARLCIHHDKAELPYQDGYHHLIGDVQGPIASLNSLVVHPSMRRQGLSRALTPPRIAAARALGARSILVEAAPNRVPPLRELGFVALGECVNQPGYLARFTLMKLEISP